MILFYSPQIKTKMVKICACSYQRYSDWNDHTCASQEDDYEYDQEWTHAIHEFMWLWALNVLLMCVREYGRVEDGWLVQKNLYFITGERYDAKIHRSCGPSTNFGLPYESITRCRCDPRSMEHCECPAIKYWNENKENEKEPRFLTEAPGDPNTFSRPPGFALCKCDLNNSEKRSDFLKLFQSRSEYFHQWATCSVDELESDKPWQKLVLDWKLLIGRYAKEQTSALLEEQKKANDDTHEKYSEDARKEYEEKMKALVVVSDEDRMFAEASAEKQVLILRRLLKRSKRFREYQDGEGDRQAAKRRRCYVGHDDGSYTETSTLGVNSAAFHSASPEEKKMAMDDL